MSDSWLFLFFLIFCRMKERKINSKFWSQGGSRNFNSMDLSWLRGTAFKVRYTKKKLSFPVHYLFGFLNTASEKHKHKQKLKRCDITGSFMDTVYYIVCIIIFISSERAPTYRCFTWYSRRSFLKQNLVLNIPTTDFEGAKTRPVLHFCEICCFL